MIDVIEVNDVTTQVSAGSRTLAVVQTDDSTDVLEINAEGVQIVMLGQLDKTLMATTGRNSYFPGGW